MRIEKLVEMANDIGNYFRSEPDHAEAVAGIANHLQKFWDPRMRSQFLEYYNTGGEGIEPIVREALDKIKADSRGTVDA